MQIQEQKSANTRLWSKTIVGRRAYLNETKAGELGQQPLGEDKRVLNAPRLVQQLRLN